MKFAVKLTISRTVAHYKPSRLYQVAVPFSLFQYDI